MCTYGATRKTAPLLVISTAWLHVACMSALLCVQSVAVSWHGDAHSTGSMPLSAHQTHDSDPLASEDFVRQWFVSDEEDAESVATSSVCNHCHCLNRPVHINHLSNSKMHIVVHTESMNILHVSNSDTTSCSPSHTAIY